MKSLSFLCFLLLLVAGVTFAKPNRQAVTVKFRYKIEAGEKTKQAKFICLLPQTITNRQEVLETTFSVQPSRLFRENGNLYAEFVLAQPVRQQEILISATLYLYQYDLQSAEQDGQQEQQKFFTDDSLSFFLKEEKFIEKSNQAIAALATKLRGADTRSTLKNIYAYVNQELSYGGYEGEDRGAAKALSSRTGDCSEFADLFVALCRARQVPARVVEGYITDWTNTPKHSWVEVYTPALGWVPFDPTPGNRSRFSSMRNRYLYLSTVRNDQVLNNYHFYTYLSWGEPIQVSGTFNVTETQQGTELAGTSVL